jgi:putative DNA primase/helicase
MVPANSFLARAAALATLGFSVFPLHVRGKKPLIDKWGRWQDERAGKAQLLEWARKWPDANVAIATGPVSGIVVLDLDTAEGEEKATLLGVPLTPCVRTGKGCHFYFRCNDFFLRNFAGKLPGIDLRAAGGYVVGPGSVHPSRALYEWVLTPDQLRFANPPSWLFALAKEPSQPAPNGTIVTNVKSPKTSSARSNSEISAYAQKAFDEETARVRSAIEGARNHTLNCASFALGQLIAGGELSDEMVRPALLDAAQAVGLGERETRGTIESGLSAGKCEPRTAPAREGDGVSVDRGEPPRPLRRDIPPTQPYPDDALGNLLGDRDGRAQDRRGRSCSCINEASRRRARNQL